MTALHIAAEEGFEQIVKFLIEHGSNVHLQDQVFIFFFFFFLICISLFFLIFFICCCGLILYCFYLLNTNPTLIFKPKFSFSF